MKFIETNNIKGDILGGITAGIVALPLALAFGIQAFSGIDDPAAASLGAYAGLAGAMMLGFFASLFGGTHSQISGPTGPMTVIAATLVSGAWASADGSGSFSQVLITMSMAGIFCGLFQILFGLIRLGKYIRYIPYPVLSGFMSGIGVIIILQQLYPLLGKSASGSMVQLLVGLPTAAGGMSLTALLLGLGTVAIIYLFPLITKKLPATLVALIVMTVVSLFCDMEGVPTIGEIPGGLPKPFFANGVSLSGLAWGDILMASIIPSLTLAGLGSIDTLLTSVVADNITKTKHNSNRELIGQGIGNAIAGLFGGLPGAGATMRTVVNVKSGGRTQLSGMTHALLLLAIMLGLGSLVKYVPLSVLAGILITVGIGIVDIKGFKDLTKIPRADAVVLVTVFLVTVFVDLLTAVGIGMVIACVLFMKRASDLVEGGYSTSPMTPEDVRKGLPNPGVDNFDKTVPWHDEGGISPEILSHIYIQRLNGPIFFGSITKFQDVMHDVPDDAKIVIIRMRLVSFMDQSGLYAMETAIKDLQARGVMVLMTIIQPQPMYMLKTMKVIPTVVPEEHTFKTFEDCTLYLNSEQVREKVLGK